MNILKTIYPHHTDYSNRLVFIPEKNLDRVTLLENCPRITASNPLKTPFLKDILESLGHERDCGYKFRSYGDLAGFVEAGFRVFRPPGLIIDRAELLFEKRSPKIIVRICEFLASLAQSGKTQLVLIGNDSILKIDDTIVRSKYSGWLIMRTHWVVDREADDSAAILKLRESLGLINF